MLQNTVRSAKVLGSSQPTLLQYQFEHYDRRSRFFWGGWKNELFFKFLRNIMYNIEYALSLNVY